MCTLVLLRRPGHAWPLIVAANRDEMAGRASRPPARHWPDRAHVAAGLDEEAGGTWLAVNDDGVLSGILNRPGSLGPAPGVRSRGELPLEACDHAEAEVAAAALTHLEPASYRSFNLVIADARKAFWLRSEGADGERVEAFEVPEGLSMVTAQNLNDDANSPRMQRARPRFEAARVPDPDNGDWGHWQALLADRDVDEDATYRGAMNVETDFGFGTVSSSLIALPDPSRLGVKPVWLYCDGRPDEAEFSPVPL